MRSGQQACCTGWSREQRISDTTECLRQRVESLHLGKEANMDHSWLCASLCWQGWRQFHLQRRAAQAVRWPGCLPYAPKGGRRRAEPPLCITNDSEAQQAVREHLE